MTGEHNHDSDRELLVNQVIAAYLEGQRLGQAPDRQELLRRHPDLASALQSFFEDQDRFSRLAEPPTMSPGEPPIPPPPTKVRYFGDYELLEEIARGGMGVVYRARQVSLNRIVALKMILAGQLASPSEVQRFLSEAEAAANLDHPNIVPIYEVGEHDGQHYFSMRLIDGDNLANTVASGQWLVASKGKEQQAARLMATLAAAVHYAHQHGVLHRDLKPANILLDDSGQPHITDFGLAKRVSSGANPAVQAHVPLTHSGAILGTPAYMAPEQAAGKRALTTAVDVYSLGAVLYELLTGRRPFQAETPFEIVQQVLEREPQRPSLLNTRLDRDLETICLKCLEKDPQRRYGSAEALARDLEHWLADEPIQARRSGTLERAVRWVRKRRRGIKVTTLTAAASVLLVVAALIGWQWYAESRLGRLMLLTDGPALVAEVLFEDRDDPVAQPFTVPTQAPISLPAGSYRLRLSGQGMLSETAQLLVRKGILQQFSVKLGAGELWDHIPVSHGFQVVDLAGRSDVVLATDKGLRRLDGASGKEIWDLAVDAKDLPGLAKDHPFNWTQWWFGPSYARPGRLVRPAPDLDGDGVGDVVCAGGEPASLLAISGKDGKPLWLFSPQPVLPEALKEHPQVFEAAFRQSIIVGQPATVEVDGDGTPDFIVTFALNESGNVGIAVGDSPSVTVRSHPWIQAVSGRTGKSLWRYDLDSRATAAPKSPAQLIRVGGKQVVAVAAGTILVGLDLRTGKPAWPVHDVGQPVDGFRFADLDGDGQDDALLFGMNYVKVDANTSQNIGAVFTALSLPTCSPLWQIGPEPRANFGYPQPESNWPIVTDLDGDGKAEVILLNSNNRDASWWRIDVLDGATGQPHWPKPPAVDRWENRTYQDLVVGPDIDGDGQRDLFVVSQGMEHRYQGKWAIFLLVDALSGKDGRVLWTWRQRLGNAPSAGSLKWWQPGRDGLPQLLVPTKETTYVLSASSGRLEHVLPGVFDIHVADFDGDGILDLYEYRADRPNQVWLPGKLYSIRGLPPAAWQRLDPWKPAQDFNGDGSADLLDARGPTTAISGRDGRALLQSIKSGLEYPRDPQQGSPEPFQTWMAPDLNGDGTPDFVGFGWCPGGAFSKDDWRLRALSGKTGDELWETSLGSRVVDLLEFRDLDNDGKPEVIAAFSTGNEPASAEVWLAVLSGQSGKQIWKQRLGGQLVRAAQSMPQFRIGVAVADVNEDGVQDLILWGNPDEKQSLELCAFSGRNGESLWHWASPIQPTNDAISNQVYELPAPLVADLDGDGKLEVAVADSFRQGEFKQGQGTMEGFCEVTALDSKDGKPKWTWQGKHGSSSFEAGAPYANRLQVPVPKPQGSRPETGDMRGMDRGGMAPAQGKTLVQHWSQSLLLNLDGDGRRCVCVTVPSGDAGFQKAVDSAVILNHLGKVRQATPLPRSFAGEGPRQLWSADLDGDGRDELICVVGGPYSERGKQIAREFKVRVSSGGAERVLWEWSIPGEIAEPGSANVAEILGVRPHRPDSSAMVVVSLAQTVYGLAGATGQASWRCDGPRLWPLPRFTGPVWWPAAKPLWLESNRPQERPRVLFYPYRLNEPPGTVCRLGLPTTPTGQYLSSKGVAATAFGPLPADPRFARPFPWAAKSFSWGVLWLILSAGIYVYFVLSLAGRRQLRRLIRLLFLTLAVSLVICILWLYLDYRDVGSFRYLWSGWYGGVFVGVCVVGILIPVVLGIKGLANCNTTRPNRNRERARGD